MQIKKIVTSVTDCNTSTTSENTSWEVTSQGSLWVLTDQEALSLYNRLGKALTANTGHEPLITGKAIAFARQGNWDGKLKAIKEMRFNNDCTLKEAKEIVEKYMSDNNIPNP